MTRSTATVNATAASLRLDQPLGVARTGSHSRAANRKAGARLVARTRSSVLVKV